MIIPIANRNKDSKDSPSTLQMSFFVITVTETKNKRYLRNYLTGVLRHDGHLKVHCDCIEITLTGKLLTALIIIDDMYNFDKEDKRNHTHAFILMHTKRFNVQIVQAVGFKMIVF
jgi:hypothetical protein